MLSANSLRMRAESNSLANHTTKMKRNILVSLSLLAIVFSSEVVDAVRTRLEADSAFWFGLVKYSGYAVALGCAMEAPETFILIKQWWLLRFRGIEREETGKDKISIIVPLAALGLFIIVVGIVAETYCEGKVSDVDALLRAHESDKITAAEGEATAATKQAGGAAESAQRANDAEKNLEGKAAALDKHIDAAEKRLAWLGTRDIPLFKERKSFPRYIGPFNGQKIVVTVCGGQYLQGDQELWFPAGTLVAILRDSRWATDGSTTTDESCPTLGMGITLQERSDAPEKVKKAAFALQTVINKALSQGGFQISVAKPEGFLLRTQGQIKYFDADTLKLEVRMHPPISSPLTAEETEFLKNKP